MSSDQCVYNSNDNRRHQKYASPRRGSSSYNRRNFAHSIVTPHSLVTNSVGCSINTHPPSSRSVPIPNYSKRTTATTRRIVKSPIIQLTPQQKQWTFLSQRAQNFKEFPDSLFPALFKDIVEASALVAKRVKLFGCTCEELEREQTSVYPSSRAPQCMSMTMPMEQHGLSATCTHLPAPSGPSFPIFYSNTFSFLDEPAKKVYSDSVFPTTNDMDEATQDFLIPFEKEECELQKCSQCPFGNNCFFAHMR